MSRHDRDAVSLMGGLLLGLIALFVLLDEATTLQLDVAWVLPGLLVAIGLVGLLASGRRREPVGDAVGDTREGDGETT